MNKQQEPRLRFKDFTEVWEEKVLGEILSVRNEFVDSSLYDLDVELENLISNSGILVGDTSVRTQTTSSFRKGDILFGRLRPYLNKWWLAEKDGVKSGEIWALETSSKYSNSFAYLLVQSRKFLETANVTSGTKMPRADWRSLTAITFKSPSKPEQTHLGLFFSRLDSQIAESRAVLEKSRQLKKAMLAKMFPTNGEKIPEIRFKGFEGEWETYQICDLFRITRGNVLATTNLVDNKNEDYCYPVYSSQTKNKGLMGYWKHYLFENAITWTTDGANAGDVNFRSGKFYCTNVCGVLINEEGFANQCIAEILNLVTHSYVSYVGNPKLMNNVMAEIPILIPPTIKEQTAIGNFFRQLDETIALQSAEVEKLNQLKKGLLAAMLV